MGTAGHTANNLRRREELHQALDRLLDILVLGELYASLRIVVQHPDGVSVEVHSIGVEAGNLQTITHNLRRLQRV